MDQRKSVENSVNFWLKQARGERVGAFITRLIASTSMPIAVGGGLVLLNEGRVAAGALFIAGGVLGFIGLNRFANSEELEALNCESHALPYQLELRSLQPPDQFN